jgi:D-methionine transport system ATP-binding protein
LIKLENIYKTYRTPQGQVEALTAVNLAVQRGEIFGVIGKSGAGKSTLIRCVNLLERPDQGAVWVDGQDIMQLSTNDLRLARHKIGMIFQHFNLLNIRTVYHNVSFPLELLGKAKQEIKKIVMSLLELTGLTDKMNAYPSQLSGGQKQRVAIARALATNPSVLLCDEMTSALDPETTASILQLIKNINRQFNLSVLLITHEMDVIKAIVDRVAVIDQGKIIEENNVLNLFKNPQTAIAKRFTHSAIHIKIPESLINKLQTSVIPNAYTLLRLDFIGKTAAEPIINDLIKHFDLQINIIEAHLEMLRGETIGAMLLAAFADPAEIHRGIAYLIEKGLQVEVVGYVERNDWLTE